MIKKQFRAFDKTINEMLLPTDLRLAPCRWVYDGGLDDMFSNASEDVIFMQFLDIKDKNGVEIYEGDIVQDEEDRQFELGYCFKYKKDGDRNHLLKFEMRCIKESNLVNYKFTKVGNIVNLLYWIHPKCSLEIIGNIYENKELLK